MQAILERVKVIKMELKIYSDEGDRIYIFGNSKCIEINYMNEQAHPSRRKTSRGLVLMPHEKAWDILADIWTQEEIEEMLA